MTKWGRRLFSIAFSFMFLFITVGYAQLADTLVINGTAAWRYEGVYITNIEAVSANGVAEASVATHFIPTNVITNLTVTGENNATREIVYKVTVHNNTNYKYSYKGIICDASLDNYQNDLYGKANGFAVGVYEDVGCTKEIVADNSNVQDDETSVEAGSTLDFYVKYTFTKTAEKNTEVKTLINYSFDIHIDSLGDMAAAQAASKFLNALNNPAMYAELAENIDNKFESKDVPWGDTDGDGVLETYRGESLNRAQWQANYIGNVDGSSDSDKAVVQDMLSGLQIVIDGKPQDVKAIIKRINVDGNKNTGDAYSTDFKYQLKNSAWGRTTTETFTVSDSGCEMVLYMTADNLDRNPNAGEYGENGDSSLAKVYIIVFTCKNYGSTASTPEWYQVGDIYEGHCPIVGYDGGAGGTGSFITDDWTSIGKSYKVTENYSYNIEDGDGRDGNNNPEDILEVMAETDANANAEFRRLKADADALMVRINNGDFDNSAFSSVVSTMRTVYEKAEEIESTLTNSTIRAELISIMKELENALYPFKDHM